MPAPLRDTEIRILGSLMEKALATPEYYPLSLNALAKACNHKESRYTHLLGDRPAAPASKKAENLSADASFLQERVALLEDQLSTLQADMAALRTAFQAFKAQFA